MPPNPPFDETNPESWPQNSGPLRRTVRPYAPSQVSTGNPTATDGIDDWIVPGNVAGKAAFPDDWIVPGNGQSDAPHPNNWIAPPIVRNSTSYPDDWFVPSSSANNPQPGPNLTSGRDASGTPFPKAGPGSPANQNADLLAAYFSLNPAGLAGARAWRPSIFQEAWPPASAMNLPAPAGLPARPAPFSGPPFETPSGFWDRLPPYTLLGKLADLGRPTTQFPIFGFDGNLFPSLLDVPTPAESSTATAPFSDPPIGTASGFGDRLPPYTLLGKLADLGRPTMQSSIFGSDGNLFASLPDSPVPAGSSTATALFSGPPIGMASGFEDRLPPYTLLGKLADLVPQTPPIQWAGVTQFPDFGSSGIVPASAQALPFAGQTPTLPSAEGGSLNSSAPSGSGSNPLARFLNALNPISSANAAEDESGGLPPALLQLLLQGSLDAATAKRLAEQQKILKDAEDAKRELFEVAQGRASSRALGVALEASGVPRPPGYAAHHIAAGADERGELARDILKKFNIGINDVSNGVFLPAHRATQVIAGETIHSTLHTKKYYDAVNEALARATTRQQVISILQSIRLALQSGDYP